MTSKDIEKIYDDLENYLIQNIKRNLTSDLKSFHLNEEKALGFDWEAWQSTKLKELKRYRRQNKEIINKRLANIDSQVAEVLMRESQQGKLDAFKNFKEALIHGYKSSVEVKDSFFKLNDRKLNKLINSINHDFKVANKAVLRQSNDVYRKIISEASFYNQTGVMTERQAIRKAINDFEMRGINCIEYSNGSRHKISDYSKMAIRTASTRAYLQGEGEFRKKIGSTLVLMSKHNTACKLCQPFEGKVLIDDVYSGGTKKDGRYTLLSEAMKQGLYHPNCRHGHGTYYPELGKKTSNEIVEKVEEPIKDLPKFVDKIDDEKALYHSFQLRDYANQFVNGSFVTFKHEYGTGFYTTKTKKIAQKYNDGYVMKLALSEDAKIGDWATLKTEMIKSNSPIKDVGIYALMKGYDAIYQKATQYTIIVNREKVLLEKSIKKIFKEKK